MFPLLHAWSESPAQLSAAHSSASTEGTEVPSEQNLISTTTATLWSPMARAHDPKKLKTACSTALSTVVVEIPTSAGEIKSDGPKEGSSAMHVNAGSDCGEAVPLLITPTSSPPKPPTLNIVTESLLSNFKSSKSGESHTQTITHIPIPRDARQITFGGDVQRSSLLVVAPKTIRHSMRIRLSPEPGQDLDSLFDDDVIRAFYRGKRNLVIDSLNPRLFPHIVITPAVEDVFDDFFVAWRNRTEPQWLAFLCVPASDISPASLPPVLWRPSQVEHPGNETRVETSIDANLCDRTSCQNADSDKAEGPKRVFSYSRFTVFSERAAEERLFMYHVVSAIQRHLCKSVAYAASTLAMRFRTRYDSSELAETIERPFVWNDPAEPVLEAARRYNTIILESLNPLHVPHIVINTAPPENPWVSYMNAACDPQDCGYGQLLVVPASCVTYINYDQDDVELELDLEFDGDNYDDHDWETCHEGTYSGSMFYPEDEDEEDEDDLCDDTGSTVSSSPPETPLDTDVVDPFLDPGCDGVPPRQETCSSVWDTDSELGDSETGATTYCNKFAIEDDEDDDLPDLNDDWYRSIMQRTKMVCVTSDTSSVPGRSGVIDLEP